jgi:hypothetical protein
MAPFRATTCDSDFQILSLCGVPVECYVQTLKTLSLQEKDAQNVTLVRLHVTAFVDMESYFSCS